MQGLPRIPRDRIAILIGRKGETKAMLQKAAGCKKLAIDSESGDVSVIWGPPGSYDPIKALKLPDVIKAIGRGMAPKKAIQLLNDEWFFQLVDIREFVGKRSNQQRRIRSRLIGTDGKIRRLIERNTGCEITIYGSTVVVVGDEAGLAAAVNAVQRLAEGAEHGSVINQLEKERRRIRMSGKVIDYIEEKSEHTDFDDLVPGLADVTRRRNRKLKTSQVNPDDVKAVKEMMNLEQDESVKWEEE